MDDGNDLRHALCLMRDALKLLDSSAMAIDAGAHLDLAIHRLEESLGLERGSSKREPSAILATRKFR